VILADSSIWIDFFRAGNPQMRRLLDREEILMHRFVVAELALGSLKDRKQTLGELDRMDMVTVADTIEVRRLIEARSLYSRGIGFVDAHLIASCLLAAGVFLWTRDSRLANAARSIGIHPL
jgi:predicted nucleic acid-binding protein